MQDKNLKKPVVIRIELPTNAYFMSGIRDFTLKMIENTTDFSKQWAYRFQSVVDELCNNAIEHGSKPNDFILITFISIANESIEIIVEDHGKTKEKIAEQILKKYKGNAQKSQIELGIRGRGLAYIVDKWTDELEIQDRENGGVKVRVKKYLNDPEFQKDTSEDPTHLKLTI